LSQTSQAPNVNGDSVRGGSSNNTGIIAGSVVGGVAVLAICGVAVLWILKRSKHEKQTAAATTPYEKAELPGETVNYTSQQTAPIQLLAPTPPRELQGSELSKNIYGQGK